MDPLAPALGVTTADARPEPERLREYGSGTPSLSSSRTASSSPTTVGWYSMSKEHCAPPARSEQSPASTTAQRAALVPVSCMPDIASGSGRRLLSVTDRVAVEPTGTAPKSTAVGSVARSGWLPLSRMESEKLLCWNQLDD